LKSLQFRSKRGNHSPGLLDSSAVGQVVRGTPQRDALGVGQLFFGRCQAPSRLFVNLAVAARLLRDAVQLRLSPGQALGCRERIGGDAGNGAAGHLERVRGGFKGFDGGGHGRGLAGQGLALAATLFQGVEQAPVCRLGLRQPPPLLLNFRQPIQRGVQLLLRGLKLGRRLQHPGLAEPAGGVVKGQTGPPEVCFGFLDVVLEGAVGVGMRGIAGAQPQHCGRIGLADLRQGCRVFGDQSANPPDLLFQGFRGRGVVAEGASRRFNHMVCLGGQRLDAVKRVASCGKVAS
jgi:hypothetical protein